MKTIRYKLRNYDAEVLDVQSNDELVELMREFVAFIPAMDNESFMRGLADQVRMESGDEVRTDSVDNFVSDLLSIGFLKKVENDEADKDDA
jgi:hypothetical protein